MQITIQTLPPLRGGLVLTRQIEALMHDLLEADRDTLLELDVQHGPGSDAETVDDDVHCDLRARLANGLRVSVCHAAPTLVQALHGATTKLRTRLQPQRERSFAF